MSSPDPPDDRKKSSMGQSIRSGFRRTKDAIKRRPSPHQPSGQSEHLATLSPRAMLQSFLGRSSPNLVAGPVPSESNRLTNTPPPRPSTQGSASNAAAEPIEAHTRPQNAAWTRLKSSLRALEASVELFPPLHSAIGSFIGCLDILQAAASNREDYDELAEELQSMVKVLTQYAGRLKSESSKGSVANIAQCLERQVESIERKANRSTVGRLLDATQDQEDVMRQYRHIERLLRQLQCELLLRTADQTEKILETTLLGKVSPVDDARYNSGYSTTVRRRGCTAQTREAIHRALQDWTTNPDSEAIYWMNGMAGTGKTTIAYTFCEWLETTNRLGGSFFCSRISSSCRSLNQIVPTLAHQLAHFSPAYRSKLCTALNDNPEAGKLNVMQQFERLINQPMLKAKDAIPDSIVVVIDALDECDDSYSVRLLLDVLLKFADQLPVKFFVSSRPEHVIRDRMVSLGGAKRAIVHLHDIEQSIVEEDIKKYLTEALSSMSPPPSSEDIALLAKRSRNLFIYAATVVRYIHPTDFHVNSAKRLKSMLAAIGNPSATAKNKYEDLDLLYTTVLDAVFHTRLDDDEKECMQHVLWTVVCAKEPIIVATIAILASVDEAQVWSALQSLRSVVHVPENNTLISTLHASFPEYMLDQSRSKQFYCNESQSNGRLTHRLFDIMKQGLRFNICNLKSSYDIDKQVEDLEARVTQHISPTLSYSCRYWSAHLLSAPYSISTRELLSDFLSNRLLLWMEVLSLCRCVGGGAPMLQQAQTWLRVEDAPEEMQKRVSDARNFVTWFAANPCSPSTSHIYISALPFCAKSNWVYQHYSGRFQGLGNIQIDQRDDTTLVIWGTQSDVYSIAISPDGSRVAAGTRDGSVQIYDMNTGAVVMSFKGHTDTVYSVTFSPDGSLLASASQDGSAIIWDTHTGRILTGPLQGHTDQVTSVAFSPDGKRLVTGSNDCTVQIWDVFKGVVVLGPLRGHSAFIWWLAFSPDGRYIVSCSEDSTIRLWDAFAGTMVTEPLTANTGPVYKVAFCPDGNRLASCSDDKTVRMWDIPAGTAVGQPLEGHKDRVTSLAFSSDGSKLISGGGDQDRSIVVWDIQTKPTALRPLQGHTEAIWSLAFSPDNTRVVSGSDDKTIRIWDVLRESEGPGKHHSRETSVGAITFSPDCTRFISSLSNGGLHTWDLRTGAVFSPTFEGNDDLKPIRSVAFSPHGTHVIAASDLVIFVWNTVTRAVASRPLNGHTDSIGCLAFSPDGSFICSGSDDCTIIVWDIDTGTRIGQPYTGHTGSVRSVTFSPDGTCIASGATDQTMRVWDPATGITMHILNGHDGSVESVAFSPNGKHIISGSLDGRIRKWDVEGKCAVHSYTRVLNNLGPSAPGQPAEYDCESPINFVAFSPDGTRIIAGSGSAIQVFDPQITELLSKLSLPYDETVQWVGFSPDGNDTISVSTSEKDIQRATEDTNQQTSQPPNIIRVWRAGAHLDNKDFSSETGYWSLERDGRILSPEGFVAWVPPDILPYLGRCKYSSTYYNPFVLSPEGIIDLGYKNLCIGDKWTECYNHKD